MGGRSKRLGFVAFVLIVLGIVGSVSPVGAADDDESCFFYTRVFLADPILTQVVGGNFPSCGASIQCPSACTISANAIIYGVGLILGEIELELSDGTLRHATCGSLPTPTLSGCQATIPPGPAPAGIHRMSCDGGGVAVATAGECHVRIEF